MDKNKILNKTETKVNEFIEYRNGLPSFDKKLEAAKLINHISTVNVNNAYKKVSSKINNKNKRITFFDNLIRLAAIFTLPLLAFTVWTLFFQKDVDIHNIIAESEITWQEITSPPGTRMHVILPDGSNMWLNAGSNLRYGLPFIREIREVELSGEAFFDIINNEQSPFMIKTGNTSVEVLGTQFNVKARTDENQIQVAIKSGKVKFRFSDNNGINKFSKLLPNDFMEFDKNKKTVVRQNTNIEKYIAWYQNIMVLDNTPITELAKLLEQWYGVKVVISSDDIKRHRFTTTFDNEPLHRVLELLELSTPDIRILYTMGKPIEGTKKFSPSVITITKR